jgi:hypothetical protein
MFHITGKNILPLEDKSYPQYDEALKPNGFWVSKGQWGEFIKREGFSISGVKYCYIVGVDLSKALTISTIEDLKIFNNNYGIYTYNLQHRIDWSSVKKDYPAIVFENYTTIRQQVPENSWYLSLDCACCCIFDIKIINKIEMIKDFAFEWDC